MDLILLCLKIFIARVSDVSLGTIKTVFIVKEKKLIATLMSFIEILIWFIVAKEALNTEINSILIPISYSLGYATGTYVGIVLSSKLIKGTLTVNIISSKIRKKDINYLKELGYGVSSIQLENKNKYLIMEINKNKLSELKNEINRIDKNAFIIVNETKTITNGYFDF